MSLPVKYELECKLIELRTKKQIATFKARVARDRRVNASFESGNIASGGHSFAIATPDLLDYKAYTHQVEVEGYTYVITAYQPLTHMQVGITYSKKKRVKEILLELE